MSRPFKLIGGAVALLILLVGGLYAYRSLMLWDGRTPEGYELLAAMPGSAGFEPKTLPVGPVLENQSAGDLAVNFGYKVGGISYSYSLALAFPGDGAQGTATLVARHATRSANLDVPVTRRWDEPRKAYQVALAGRFDIEPAVPALCVKAVVGPSLKGFDTKDASLCVAQRDVKGECHPETLACGLIR
jgi:hypothetical protein